MEVNAKESETMVLAFLYYKRDKNGDDACGSNMISYRALQQVPDQWDSHFTENVFWQA